MYFCPFSALTNDNTHFKRKRSQNSARSLNCAEWKSAFTLIFWFPMHEFFVKFLQLSVIVREVRLFLYCNISLFCLISPYGGGRGAGGQIAPDPQINRAPKLEVRAPKFEHFAISLPAISLGGPDFHTGIVWQNPYY